MADLPSASADTALTAILTGTMYLSLHTGDTSTTGANEVTGGSYARKLITFAAASAGAKDSSDAQSFASMPSATVTYLGVWTAATGGTFLWGGALTSSLTVPSGATVDFASGGVVATITG